MGDHLLLYDGLCGLCNRVNRLVLRYDREGRFDFAPIQGPTGRALLTRFGEDPDALETFFVVAQYRTASPTLLSRSSGVLFVLEQFGSAWRGLSSLLRLVPRALRDAGYAQVARRRYRLFGRYEVCPLPSPEHRARFIDSGGTGVTSNQ